MSALRTGRGGLGSGGDRALRRRVQAAAAHAGADGVCAAFHPAARAERAAFQVRGGDRAAPARVLQPAAVTCAGAPRRLTSRDII